EAVERQPVRTLEPSRHIGPVTEAIGFGKTLERVSLECLAGNERVALDDQHWLNRSAPSHGKPPTRPSSHPGIQVQRVSRLRVAAVLPVRSDRLALLAALDGIGELRSEIQRWHQSSEDVRRYAPTPMQHIVITVNPSTIHISRPIMTAAYRTTATNGATSNKVPIVFLMLTFVSETSPNRARAR